MYSSNLISSSKSSSELFFEKLIDFFDVLPFFLVLFGLIFIYIIILLIAYLRTGISYHKSMELFFNLKYYNSISNSNEKVENEIKN